MAKQATIAERLRALGEVVDQSTGRVPDEALQDGLLAALRGDVPASTLDAPAYTAEVVAELDDLIAAGARVAFTGPVRTVRP